MVLLLALIPVFSPKEKVNHAPVSWKIMRRDWWDTIRKSESGLGDGLSLGRGNR
jgi:hypothetical protein